MANKHLYKVVFVNQNQVYEVYARGVHQDHLYGFVAIEELVFGEQSEVVVDPSEERLKREFEGVERTYVPMHAVIRIDEVQRRGTSKISPVEGDNVTSFPGGTYGPGPDAGKK